MKAAGSSGVEIVKLLLDAGANREATDEVRVRENTREMSAHLLL